jgi:hypothetical protein
LDWSISSITYNPNKPEEVGVFMGATHAGTLAYSENLWVINYPTMARGTASIRTSLRGLGGNLSFDPINSKWVLLEDYMGGIPGIDYALWRLNYDGSAIEYASPALFDNDAPFLLRGTNTQRLYIQYGITGDFYATDDGGDTRTLIGDSEEVGQTRWSYACDPTGQFIMGNWTAAGQRGMSGDYGYTWFGIPNLPAGGAYAFAYAGTGGGSASGWIAAHGIVRYSPNFGSTWVNKEGNLLQIAPIPDIYAIFCKVDTRTI